MKNSKISVILGLLCVVGLLLAGRGYYVLLAIDDAMKTQEALDNTFSALIKSKAVTNKNFDDSALNDAITHLTQNAEVRETVLYLTKSIEATQLILAMLLVGLFILTSILLNRSVISKNGEKK
jgi:tRNA uridine 5-carbamoylmethylation protein Kti12